jgi:hypothetical protein
METRMNRKQIQIASTSALDKNDKDYWAKAPVEEKLKTITYLRECFYGAEATTGRLQRFYQILKLK